MKLITYYKDSTGKISVFLNGPLWWWEQIKGMNTISHPISDFSYDLSRFEKDGLDVEDFTWYDDFSRSYLDDSIKYLRICLYKWKKAHTQEGRRKAEKQFRDILPLSFLDTREICFDSQDELRKHLANLNVKGLDTEWDQYENILWPIFFDLWEEPESTQKNGAD